MAKHVTPQIIEALHKRWSSFSQRLNAKNSDRVWQWIKAAYLEPHRYYHNLNHLYHCFQELDAIPGQHLPEIELALWFHDIAYQTHPPMENELESSKIAINAIGVMNLPNGYCPLVDMMIMATKNHKNDIDNYSLMLDIDLSILGQSSEIFQAYDQQINQEYQWVPLELYNKTRADILQNFLNSPMIYKTDLMRDKYEAQARMNLEETIKKLRLNAN